MAKKTKKAIDFDDIYNPKKLNIKKLQEDDFFEPDFYKANISDFDNLTKEEIESIDFEKIKNEISEEIEFYLNNLAKIYLKDNDLNSNEFILSKIRRDARSTARIETIIKICEESLYEIANKIHKKETANINELMRAVQVMAEVSKTLRDLQSSSDIQFKDFQKSYKDLRLDIDYMKDINEISEQMDNPEGGKLTTTNGKVVNDLLELIKRKSKEENKEDE